MFETLSAAPPDAILGLTEKFKKDPNPSKINLGVGVYKDASGITPILRSVKEAEGEILNSETTKSYLPIDGSAAYNAATQALIFGDDHEIISSRRAATLQAPGGTGALRVAADFVARNMPGSTVWLSNPTWPNHPGILSAAGVEAKTYPYFDSSTDAIDFEAMQTVVRQIPAGDVLLLHGCCHNPTGVDLTLDQWRQVAEIVSERKILPLIDFAYQGFADGLREDAAGILTMCNPGTELLVASSYSKNFGLYNERVGALTIVTTSEETAQTALSQAKVIVRTNYSNPPDHGAAIVSTILSDPDLRAEWEDEVTGMRDRINAMRHLFAETLNEKGATQDFSFITRQRGMFSFSGLTPDQVQRLRDEYSIYIVGSGRISVAGMSEESMDYLCSAIADVLAG